ncbi:right-handed parallel beta-helix repeat-containing protein [Methanobrevibacter sp.]|uniref:right-handed parallel beta-helix repeat-containing protein n=1 Tax=Methanobrevibacter sp. TaxID=66852 RepID=UPI003890FFF4
MNVKYILIVFLIALCLVSPLYAADNVTDTLQSPQGKVINITNDNYNTYFEKYTGTILEEANISSGDTLKIGNVTNKVFIIDRQLEITAMSDNDLIKNGYVKLVNGSSGSVIHGLNIINDRVNYYTDGIMSTELHGIGLFYTDNNTLYDNSVRLADSRGVHALPMGSSSNNRIYNNSFISTLSTCVPMADCHNNLFYNNFLQTTQANIIYYNRWGHAGYGGPERCVNNTFIGNTLNSINRDSDWIIAFAIGNYDTFVINNTISNVYTGLDSLSNNSVLCSNRFINNTNVAILAYYASNITNNTFENVNMAIAVIGNNVNITNNIISNASIGIWSIGKNTVIYNNTFDIIDSYYAVTLEGDDGQILNNDITVKNYGEGIRLLGNNATIIGNNIKTAVDSSIYVLSSNNTIMNNLIDAGLYGVYIDAESTVRYYSRAVTGTAYMNTFDQGNIYNNVICDNLIDAESYDIYLWGTVYNTTIINNNMTTKESTGILIDITDPFSNNISDNIINGEFMNYTGVILNDDNFDMYFDENRTFKFGDIDKNVLMLITTLNDKELIINTKMDIMNGLNVNLLNNVHFTFINGSQGSILHDLTFRNTDKPSVTLLNVSDLSIYNNDIIIEGNGNDDLYAFYLNLTQNITVENNNVYVSAKNQTVDGIDVLNSNNVNLNNNNFILESDKSINSLILDNVVSVNVTDNTFQSYGNGEFRNVQVNDGENIGFLQNNIIATSKSNINNLEIINSKNIILENNNFDILSNHTENMIIENSSEIPIKYNKIKAISSINDDYTFDISSSDNISVIDNEIYSDALATVNGNAEISANRYVISDDNIASFFNDKGVFINKLINENDTLLFDNLKLKYYNLVFSRPFNIGQYLKSSEIDATFTFNSGSDNSNVTGLTFNLVGNPAIVLKIVSNINIENNRFNIINNDSQSVSAISIAGKSINNLISGNEFNMDGNGELIGVKINNYYDNYYGLSPENNRITDNSFDLTSNDTVIAIYNSMSDRSSITGNEISVKAENAYAVYNDYLPEYKVFMSTVITSNSLIKDNTINGEGVNVVLIYSKGLKTTVDSNSFTTSANASYAYVGDKTSGDIIRYNHMVINGSGIDDSFINGVYHSPIYFANDSSNVLILENHIVSNYEPGNDYAIYVEEKTSGVSIKDNYLISDNYQRYSNDAIYAPSAALDNNALYVVYVSQDGSDETGNGSASNPFRSIKYALDNVINDGIVNVGEGYYNESDITIAKTVTLNGIGNVYVNSTGNLFTVARSGVFTVNNINFMNANASAGSTFYNNGNLKLSNVTVSNSSASGYGGAIYNNGELLVTDSTFKSNSAKIGGVIANYKNAEIINSKFNSNGYVMNSSGGAIFNSEKGTLTINGCEFSNNNVNSVYIPNNNPRDEYGQEYGSGGVIYNRGTLYVNGSSFDSNYAYRSGGVIYSTTQNKKNTVEISNSNFTDNIGFWGPGGAISLENTILKISNSTLSNNRIYEHSGGALYVTSSSGVIYNSTFYKNSASYGGGALGIWKSNIDIILCNISDNNGEYGGALYVSSTRSGNHVVEQINIYNSTITENKGFRSGGVVFAADINLNVKNSNIYDNFASDGTTIGIQSSNEQPVNRIDVNHNWWGSANGPSDDVWLNAQYFRDWDRHINTWTVVTPNDDKKSDSSGSSSQRPVTNPDKSVTGGSTGSNLISNGGADTGSGSGSGFGTGFGNGFGSGFGQGSGTNTGFSTGDGDGSRGSGSGYAGNYTNGQGTLGDMGSSSSSGSGGSSSAQSDSDAGKAYEITKDIIKEIEKNSIPISIALIIIVLILLLIGYKRRSDEEDEL